jgi:hypothetical protein
MATNTYTELLKTTVGTATPSVTLSSIPATYTDLVLVVSATNPTNDSGLLIQFNSDSGSNYSDTSIYGNGSSAISFRSSNATGMNAGRTDTGISTNIINIQNYSNTTTYKTVLTRGNDSALVIATVGLWRNTAAITSITVYDQNARNFSTGSTFSLYGIAAEGAAYATGGMVTSDSQYYYHTFLSSGTFTPKQSLSCDALVVAGGGGGGAQVGGGGGAGGLLEFASQSLTATNYTITVGGGGAAGIYNASGLISNRGSSGTNSSLGALTAAVAGGGGGGYNGHAGLNGGSGGGSDGGVPTGIGTGTSGQGFNGGQGFASSWAGGGGGGAGAVGTNGAANIGGDGGIGKTSTFINLIGSATGKGQLVSSTYYFAGGGGGCNTDNSAGRVGVGGYGGGASGSNNSVGTSAATANTGGGGGGSRDTNPPSAGGSGIVVIRYAK